MHLLSQLKFVGAALALACALPAGAGVIDFDDVAAPILFADAAPLGARYQAAGAIFSGVSGSSGAILNDGAELGFTARSGSNFLAFEADAGVGPDQRISFASAQNGVSLFAASLETLTADAQRASFTLSAFDDLGALLGSTTIDTARDWQELSLALAGIRSVVVSSTALGWALDDLSFSGPAADVPEPASVGLIGLALAGLMAARRKRSA
jgi:hypothetical protein